MVEGDIGLRDHQFEAMGLELMLAERAGEKAARVIPALEVAGAPRVALTLIVNVCGALLAPPLSVAVTMNVEEPKLPAFGVYVSVPSDDTLGWTENRLELLTALTV